MEIRRRSVSFRMRADYCEKLKFIAKFHSISVSTLLLEIITRYIDKYEKAQGCISISSNNLDKW